MEDTKNKDPNADKDKTISVEASSDERISEAERIVREHEAALAASKGNELTLTSQKEVIHDEINIALSPVSSGELLVPETFNALKSRLVGKYSDLIGDLSKKREGKEVIEKSIDCLINLLFVRKELAAITQEISANKNNPKSYYRLKYEEMQLRYGRYASSEQSWGEWFSRALISFMAERKGFDPASLSIDATNEVLLKAREYGINTIFSGNLGVLEHNSEYYLSILSSNFGLDPEAISGEVSNWWTEVDNEIDRKSDKAVVDSLEQMTNKKVQEMLLEQAKEKLGLPKKNE